MADTRKLRVMAHIAPLIRDVDSCLSVNYNCTVDMEKNDLNTSLYSDVVAELDEYIVSIDETLEHWVLYLYDINVELYTNNYINGLDATDAEYAIKYMLDSANRNLNQILCFDASIYNVHTFTVQCVSLLQLDFIPVQINASEEELCPICGRYHSCQQQYFYPATVATYDSVQTYCDYPLGLSANMRTALNDYLLHDNANVMWNSTFNYQLDTGAVAPAKDNFSKVGFELSIIELKSTVGNTYTYKTGVTLVPPVLSDSSYHFELECSSELVAAGYCLVYPKFVTNINKVELILQKIDPEATALSLPFVAAKFVLKPDHLFIPVETAGTEIIYGPSN